MILSGDYMISKVGSIYSLNDITGVTNIFNVTGNMDIKYVLYRLIGVSEYSNIKISIDNNVSQYVIKDLNIITQDSFIYGIPKVLYYSVDDNIKNNHFILLSKIGVIKNSASVTLEPDFNGLPIKYINPKYAVEYAYAMCNNNSIMRW